MGSYSKFNNNNKNPKLKSFSTYSQHFSFFFFYLKRDTHKLSWRSKTCFIFFLSTKKSTHGRIVQRYQTGFEGCKIFALSAGSLFASSKASEWEMDIPMLSSNSNSL